MRGKRTSTLTLGALTVGIALAGTTPAGAAELRDVSHPWQRVAMDDDAVRRARESLAAVLGLPDDRIRELIPARKPISSWGNVPLGGRARWYPDRPEHVQVNGRDLIVEKEFPPTDIMRVEGPDGKAWTYEYYTDEQGARLYPTCLRDDEARKRWCWLAESLAQLYQASGEYVCAHKAAVIVARFAEIYPSYPIYGRPSNRGEFKFFSKAPYPATSGKWGGWYPTDLGYTMVLAKAYDLIAPSGAVEALSKALGRDLRQAIEIEFFLDHVRLIMRYDQWHAVGNLAYWTFNLQPGKCRALIAIGRTIGYPDIIHHAYRNLRDILDTRFTVDGVYPESPSYHRTVVFSIDKAAKLLDGYTDPPGFLDKQTGHRLTNVDAEAEFPLLARAWEFLQQSEFPDGTLMPVHETGYPRDFPGPLRARTTSRIFPAFGHAILGRGSGSNQMEAHLHFANCFNHSHDDTLNLILWASGEELLPDVGYTYTYRGWSVSSLSHNLVVVNGSTQLNQPRNPVTAPDTAVGGRILSWHPVQDGFGVVEATGTSRYPECSVYRRALLLVELDEEHAFVVDVFNVAGGNQHDWLVHGSCDRDQVLEFNHQVAPHADALAADGRIRIPMTTAEQQTRKLYTEFDRHGQVSQYWANIRQVKTVQGPGPWQATFAGTNKGDAKLRLHLLAPTDCAVYAGAAPSIRRTREHTPDVEKYMMPILTARRTGDALTSRYVAVWEPFRGQPWLDYAMITSQTERGVVVTAGNRQASVTVIWQLDETDTIAAPGVQFTGRYGCAVKRGKRRHVSLCEARTLGFDGSEFAGSASARLELVSAGSDANGDYMVVHGTPESVLTSGRWGILSHPEGSRRAVKLGVTQAEGMAMRIYCPDGLGLVSEAAGAVWRETCFPRRTFEGKMLLLVLSRVDRSDTR